MYLDDTDIFIACDTIYDVTTLANIYLDEVGSYIASNLLHINLDKKLFHVFFHLIVNVLILKTVEARGEDAKNNNNPKTETVIEKTVMHISIGKTALKEVTEN